MGGGECMDDQSRKGQMINTIKFTDLDDIFQRLYENNVINIIPLKKGEKRPKVKWTKYQNRKCPKSLIKNHKGNFGVLGGDPLNFGLNNLVVLDIDDKLGENGIYQHVKHLDTLQVKTPSKGYHIYFWSGKPIKDKNHLAKQFNLEFELRGNPKTYITLPPSFIKIEDGSNGSHEIIKLGEKFPIMEVEDIESFLKELLCDSGYEIQVPEDNSICVHRTRDNPIQVDTNSDWRAKLSEEEVKKLVTLLSRLYIEGQRNDLILYLSGWMFKAEIDRGSAYSVIKELIKGDEEYKERILTLTNTYRGLDTTKIKGSSGIFELIEKHYASTDDDIRDKCINRLYGQIASIIVHPMSRLGIIATLKGITSKNDSLKKIADFLEFRFKIVVDELSGELYIYDSETEHYKHYDGKKFLKFVSEQFPDFRFFEKETNLIKSSFTNIRDSMDHMILFPNGILDGKTMEFKSHSPDIFAKLRIPYDYNPDAKSEFMLTTLQQILVDDSGECKLQFFLEMLGYCFRYGNPHHLMFFITGDGANGKSVLMSLIYAIFGKSVSSVPLHEFEKPFGLEPLLDKKINILYDIPKQQINDTGFIKAITGQDYLSVTRKYKSSVDTRLQLKIIGSGNILPPIDDGSYAFWRRVAHIELKNKFQGKLRNRNLKEQLEKDEEAMEWLIYSSIEAYKVVESTGKWSIDLDEENIETKYLKISNPVLYATKQIFTYSNHSDDYITRTDAIQVIKDWLKLEGLKVPAKSTEYYNAIRDIGGVDCKKTILGDLERGFCMIKPRENLDIRTWNVSYDTVIKVNPESSEDIPTINELSDTERLIFEELVKFEAWTLKNLIQELENTHNVQKKTIIKIVKNWAFERRIILSEPYEAVKATNLEKSTIKIKQT